MKGIVDRIEGDYVVLEVENDMINIKKNKFPNDIKEGDIVQLENDKYVILKEETNKRKNSIEKLFEDLIE